MVKRPTHRSLKARALKDKTVKQHYDALDEDFKIYQEMIRARIEANKTQKEVADAMNTTVSVVSRIESGGGKKRHSPSIATIRKYAKAVGCKLQLRFVRVKEA